VHRVWAGWKSTLMIIKAETCVAWHRMGFRWFWTWKIHPSFAKNTPDHKPF
jgi:hypothetical protein